MIKRLLFFIISIFLSFSAFAATEYLFVGETYHIKTPSATASDGYIDEAHLLSTADLLYVDTSDPTDVTITVLDYFSNIVPVKVRFVEKYTYNGHIQKLDHDVEINIGAKYPTFRMLDGERTMKVHIKVGETTKLTYKVTPSGLREPPMHFGYGPFDLPPYHVESVSSEYDQDSGIGSLNVKGISKGTNKFISMPYGNQSLMLIWDVYVEEGGNPSPQLSLSASPSGGQVSSGTKVILTAKADGSTVSGCDIYYTLNGDKPTKSSTPYTSSGITINSNCTLKAIAYKDGYEDSEVLTVTYIVNASDASGDGSLSNPFNATAATNKAGELGVGETSSQNYYVKGRISSIKYAYNSQYGTAIFYISDDGTTENQFYVYGSFYLENKPWVDGNPQIQVGDNVIVYGKMANYKGILEMADKQNYVYSHNGNTSADTDNAIATCAEVNAGTDGTVYRVSGKVKSIENTTYGNWYLEDSTGDLYIYGTKDKNGNAGKNNSIEDWGIEVGDIITVEGPRRTYKDIVELVDVTVIDIKKNSTTGDGSFASPFTCVAATNEAGKLNEGETSSQNYYVKGIISSIKYLYNSQYGTATFYISDDGTTNDQFYVYGSYYLENKLWADGNPQIAIGDNVIVYGKMTNYNGILEMADKQNYIYSHNGNTNVTNSPKNINVILSSSGYATFYSSESAYKLPSGLSAKVVKEAGNGKLTYETIIIIDGSKTNIVPKGVPVMIESDAKQAGTYTLTATESTATYTGTNLLRGSDEATTTTGDGYHYKLSYGPTGTKWDNVFGWYWGTENGAPFQIEGHKAWLVVPRTRTRAAGFTIEGESLDIESIDQTPSTADCYYDLQGRRITDMQNATPSKKGVYIRNGQKVVVR